ncbi:NACHT, LRR and PYD domains-containing protein 2 [Vicugna pacos]|uniref:NACHT, LRR and PYD domains-containing protein 2 n=1 Tax=Vicugna pacos TaxID=30538 RepID=A0ABM5DVP9_VICPA
MLPSAQLGFHLQPLLEQLHQDELSKFKALLRTLSLKDEFQHISLTEVEEADGKQLAEILTNRCPSCWVETVTIQVFDKMNRTDLSERAKDEFREASLKSLLENKPPSVGKQDKYRNTLKKKFGQIGKNLRPGPSENVHIAPQRCEALIPFCNPKMLAGPFPHTAALQGPAGAGRTTPAERPTLGWPRGSPAETSGPASRLRRGALGRGGARTFAEVEGLSAPAGGARFPRRPADEARAARAPGPLGGGAGPLPPLLRGRPGRGLRAALRAAGPPAARGAWAQTPVFGGQAPRRLGVDSSGLQESRGHGGCHAFLRLSVRQLPAAAFRASEAAEDEEDESSPSRDAGDVQQLLSEEGGLRSPALTQVGCFLSGLPGEESAKALETAFGCQVSAEVKRGSLECRSASDGSKACSSAADTTEVLYCLCESQDEQLVKDAVAQVKEISVHLTSPSEVMRSSFCLKHCQNLEKVSLQVDKGIFLENDAALKPDTQAERSLNDQHTLPFWVDLCSVFDSNRNLTFLDISQSFLSTSSVRVLCEKIASAASSLQKVILKNLSPADAYRNICLALGGLETLTHLTFQGNDQDDLLPPLCEVLRHPKCNLQYLRLASCSATTEQWATFSSCLKISQSLTCLNLTANEFPGEAAKGLCRTLSHPKCFLQRLSLENCHLTEANCKELSSALIVSQRLTHLCLAKNALGDRGVKLLCEGLSYPECQLQTLVLWCCSIASGGCFHLSKLLRQNSRLTHLDLGLNHIGITGLKFLCESLKKPLCNLRCLWLWGCAISPVCCADLSSALQSNQNLITLDLGQNFLGYSGIKMLCDALKLQSCPLRTVRLKIDESVFRIRKLLEEIKESNPQLTIESDHQGPKHSRPSSRDFIF